jgi:hypothetical protein
MLRYVEPPEVTLAYRPPFTFQGMTARVFPLRARIDSLQIFVDNYLNFTPEALGLRFRAYAPYVNLMLVDYGKMAQTAINTGWTSQKEIVFSVPLAWYELKDGKWVFHDWASTAAFIYVDDALSMGTGRTVFGWPKTLATLSPPLGRWMSDPQAALNQATVSTSVFPNLYRGKQLEERVLLEVDRAAAPAPLGWPLDARTPFAPWVVASNLAAAVVSFGRDAGGLMRGLGIVPTNDDFSSPGNYNAMAVNLAESTFPLRPQLGGNTVNLKQFRSSKEPTRYVFQALTNGRMQLTALNRMGILGEDRMALGDCSGGYSITLHEWPSERIVQTLGLEVEDEWDGPEKTRVAKLKPVLPYWFDVNMDYLAGTNLAYRSGEDGVWHRPDSDLKGKPKTRNGKIELEEQLFNTTLGSVVDEVAGPYEFTKTTIRVLPLMANAEKLRQFVDQYLNEALESFPNSGEFSLWGPSGSPYAYVYMTVTDIGGVVSDTNNIGDWANFELMFLIPVKFQRGTQFGVGLLPAFTFVDGAIAAVARSEVLGIRAEPATFRLPDTTWVGSQESLSEMRQDLLHLRVEVFPALGEGQEAERRDIVSLVQGELGFNNGRDAWRPWFGPWASKLKDELERKKRLEWNNFESLRNLLALSLEVLGNRQPFSLYTVKQFRDVEDPDVACYRSVVRIPRWFSTVFDLREIEDPLIVRMHNYPTHPIVDVLGLDHLDVSDPGSGNAYELQPVRPFTLRVTLHEEKGEVIAGSDLAGKITLGTDFYFDKQSNVKVGQVLVAELDQGDSRRIAETTRAYWPKARRAANRLSLELARAAIDEIDPQLAVETILSREWGNWDANARWAKGRAALVTSHDNRLKGVSEDQYAKVEHAFFKDFLAGTEPGFKLRISLPGNKNRETYVQKMIDQLAHLSNLTLKMDENRRALVELGIWDTTGLPPSAECSVPEDVAVRAIESFLDSIINLGKVAVKPASPVAGTGPGIAANAAAYRHLLKSDRITQLVKDLHGPDAASTTDTFNAAWDARATVLKMADLTGARKGLQREALYDALSGASEKPDFVVRRDAVSLEQRERLFPMAESFDQDWFQGEQHDPPNGAAAKDGSGNGGHGGFAETDPSSAEGGPGGPSAAA